MNRQRSLWIGCVAAVLGLAASACADDAGWVGKRIMVKKPDLTIGYTDDQGVDHEIAALDGLEYTVEAEKGDWIKVHAHGVSGWFARNDAVLLDDAVNYFTDQIRADSDNSTWYSYRGWAWKERGELDIAIKDYNEAIRLDPNYKDAYNNRGAVWYDKKEYDKAISDYGEAIRIDANYADAYYNRGRAWSRKGEYDKAITDYSQDIRLAPSDADAFNNRGWMRYKKKEYDQAIADYDEAVRLDPNDAIAFDNRAFAWSAKKQYEKAAGDHNEAVRLDPKDGSILSDRAWFLATCPDAKHRDGKKAVESAKRACELNENKDSNDFDDLAAAYAETGAFDEAMQWEKKALEDADWAKDNGDAARARLKLYEDHKPYRDE